MLIYNLPLGDKFRIYFIEELEYLNDLEKDYGLLSSIGIKIILPKRRNDNGLEVFIKAPENSPYKNGVFNFNIKFNYDYPNHGPDVNLKTKIFHKEVLDDRNICIKFLKIWDKENVGLFFILIGLYEFFFTNDAKKGYGNEATRTLGEEGHIIFEQKCQKCIKDNSNDKFDDQLEYVFQDYYKIKKNFPICYFTFIYIKGLRKRQVRFNEINDFLKDIFKDNNVLIAGNKIYFSAISYQELANYPIILIAPNLLYKDK